MFITFTESQSETVVAHTWGSRNVTRGSETSIISSVGISVPCILELGNQPIPDDGRSVHNKVEGGGTFFQVEENP